MPASSNTILLPTGGFKRWLCLSIHREKLNGRRKLAVGIGSSSDYSPVPADGAAQKVVTESREGRALGVVLAIAVPTRGGLVKVGLIAHRLQLYRHLAGMPGMHAVITPAGRDQDR